MARIGSVHRFRSADAFATYTGTAPIAASSGDVTRHRLSRAGDRQLNCYLQTMAITHISRDTPGRDYYRRKRAAGKSHREALRCLKRRFSDVVYRQLIRDAARLGAGPGGLQYPARPAQTPHADASDKSLLVPTSSHHTTDRRPGS